MLVSELHSLKASKPVPCVKPLRLNHMSTFWFS